MRSLYLVMSIFIGVVLFLILLFSSFNNGCTTFAASLTGSEITSSNQIKYKRGEKALPWQLDAVSIGIVQTPGKEDMSSTNVQEISCAIKTGPVESRFCN